MVDNALASARMEDACIRHGVDIALCKKSGNILVEATGARNRMANETRRARAQGMALAMR
jgi:hypothetical protein